MQLRSATITPPLILPTRGFAQFITLLAEQNGIEYVATTLDALAEVITGLSGDSVQLDSIELLLLALARAGVLRSEYVVPLHVSYLREKRDAELLLVVPS